MASEGFNALDNLFLDSGSGECFNILKFIAPSQAVSPSDIMSSLGISKGKVYSCLNKLLRNGLVYKVGRGKYAATHLGKAILNMMVINTLAGKYVLDNGGKLGVDEYMDMLRKFIGPSIVDRYLPELIEFISKAGAINQESIVLVLAHLMLRDGVGDAVNELAGRTLYIRDFNRRSIVKDLRRKLVEHGFHDRVKPLIIESVVRLEELDSYSLTPIEVFGRGLTPHLDIKNVVHYSDSSSLDNHNMYNEIVLNVDSGDYIESVYQIIRRAKGRIGKYILHNVSSDTVGDELFLNMVLNDTNRGVEVYVYKGVEAVVVDDSGLPLPLDKLRGIIYNVSFMKIDYGVLDEWHIDLLQSRIFIRSLANYVELLKRFYELSAASKCVVYIGLENIGENIDLAWFVDMVKVFRESLAASDILVYPYIDVDFLGGGAGYFDMLSKELGPVGFPPREYRPIDIFDLRYGLGRVLNSGFGMYKIIS